MSHHHHGSSFLFKAQSATLSNHCCYSQANFCHVHLISSSSSHQHWMLYSIFEFSMQYFAHVAEYLQKRSQKITPHSAQWYFVFISHNLSLPHPFSLQVLYYFHYHVCRSLFLWNCRPVIWSFLVNDEAAWSTIVMGEICPYHTLLPIEDDALSVYHKALSVQFFCRVYLHL